MTNDPTELPVPTAGRAGTYTILLRDFSATVALAGLAGRHPVRIGLRLTVAHPGPGFADDISAVMSYDTIVQDLRSLCADESFSGPGLLAERAVEICLSHREVLSTQVDVELPTLFDPAAGSGVSITSVQRNKA